MYKMKALIKISILLVATVITMAKAELKYPYFASEERVTLIKSQYTNIKIGDSDNVVLDLLPDPDEIRDLFEPIMSKPKLIGKTYWYIIQRKSESGSVNDKEEKLVRVSFDRQGKVIAVDHWGF